MIIGGVTNRRVAFPFAVADRLQLGNYTQRLFCHIQYQSPIFTDFFNLLSTLTKIEGEFRIRISSIEPNLLSDKIIKLAAENEKICKHFHIPLQSGSARILKAMQRRYTVDYYEKLIYKLKQSIPECGIGVDVIVGFPGESETDFIQTHNLLRDLPVSYLHVFTYSERPDTKAISLDARVEITERKRRNNILRILSNKKKNEFYNYAIGKEAEVIFEDASHNGMMRGFSSNYTRIESPYDENFTNKICKVKIIEKVNDICKGEIIDIKNSVELVHS